jgi:hypothetical protein
MKNHPAVTFLFFGVIAGISGVLLLNFPQNSWQGSLGKMLLAISTALLGGGVFSVIAASKNYTRLLQKHLVDVFFHPEKLPDQTISLKERWGLLTKARLKGVLPQIYANATALIEEQFFNSELQYHFEKYHQKFDITVDDQGIATIVNTFKADVVRNQACTEFTFKQKSKNKCSPIELLGFRLNGIPQAPADAGFKSSDFECEFNCDLSKLGTPTVELERVITYQQDILKEPYIIATVSRYIKGGELKVRISDGYDVVFNRSGLRSQAIEALDEDSPAKDFERFRTWTLARRSDLLLPGQGFILVITSLSK